MSKGIEKIAAQFDVTGRVRSAAPHGRGHIHDSYLVEFELNRATVRCLLQRINTGVFADPTAVMENIRRVTDHITAKLRSTGCRDVERRTLTILPTRDGALAYADPEGSHWRMYRMIERATTHEVVSSPRLAEQAGRCFGEFQQLLVDLPPPRLRETIAEFHNTPSRYEALDAAILADGSGRACAAKAEIDFAQRQRSIAGLLLDAQRDGRLPERVVHNDAKIDNVLFEDATGEALCVLDLDTVMPGLALWDFGDMVRTMTTAHAEDERDLGSIGVDMTLFEAVARGHLDGTAGMLTSAEREGLVLAARVITLEQGVRFLTDFLNGDAYYKTQHTQQNLDRCRTQFKIVESITNHEDAMKRIIDRL